MIAYAHHLWATERKARKTYRCEYCRAAIPAGSIYLELKCSPAHEFSGGVWSRRRQHHRRDGQCVVPGSPVGPS